MSLINLITPGVFKSGTTTLYRFLCEHPDIRTIGLKEPRFFEEDCRKITGPFPDGYKYLLDATPSYAYSRDIMHKAYIYNREMKVIMIFRHPIDRFWSHFRMKNKNRRIGGDNLICVSEMVDVIYDQLLGDGSDETKLFFQHECLQYSMYAHQLINVLQFFPRKNVLLIKTSDLAAKINTVWDFLGLEHIKIDTDRKFNINTINVSEIPPKVEDKLFDLLYYDMRMFERLSQLSFEYEKK